MPRRDRTEPRRARELAFDTLLRVEREGAFASILLDHQQQRLEDPREAGLLHEMALGVLRRRRTLDHAIDRHARAPERLDLEVRVALRLGVYGLLYLDRVPDFAAVDSAVELVKRAGKRSAAGLVNAVLRAVARAPEAARPPAPRPGDSASLALALDHPTWWVERVVRRLGWDEAWRLLAANNEPARTILHVNTRRAACADVVAALRAEGIETEPGGLNGALRVTRGRLGASAVLAAGQAWVQDEAAQLVGCLLGRPLGPRTLDLCAAPGTKTLQIQEALAPGGWAVAVDRHPGRLRRVAPALRRCGDAPVHLLVADMERLPGPLSATFDQVLLDAPCSGSGTFRRHPEIRWRLRAEDLKLLPDRQERLFRQAGARTAPGGRLVYSVCSMEPEEGEDRVRAFIATEPAFEVVDPRPEVPPACGRWIGLDGFLRTSPADAELDGFFAAVLRRRVP